MRIATTGFVSDASGSIASANAVFLRELLRLGHSVDFFSKPSFVDPRPAVQSAKGSENLGFIDCSNVWGDRLRRLAAACSSGLILKAFESLDSKSYNRRLVKAIRAAEDADLDLWLGDWSHGRSTRPVVSFVQGAPGSDARSVFRHRALIERLAGKMIYNKLAAYARWRLTLGLPKFRFSDRVIVGSSWSRQLLVERFRIDAPIIDVIPYPIDLSTFQPSAMERDPIERLRLLWLGRFAPRKRLDLFLDGLALAIRQGCDVEAWVIGQSAFVPNYERLLLDFPFPERLSHKRFIPRAEVPAIFAQVDVMAQPSDDEDFGSSVAEALACGVPAIVGQSNGTADYMCSNSIRLADDRPETLAEVIIRMSKLKAGGILQVRTPSRSAALKHFNIEQLGKRLESILLSVV
jgi:glycosyltransferase involved in cell wall biosynthesis